MLEKKKQYPWAHLKDGDLEYYRYEECLPAHSNCIEECKYYDEENDCCLFDEDQQEEDAAREDMWRHGFW